MEELIRSNCKYYSNQLDIHGDIVLIYCDHPDNPNKLEGNCTHTLCPMTGDSSEDFS